MRRYGPAPSPTIHYRDRPGVYAVILSGADILLAEQNGDFLLPGGGIEPGESILAALHREVWEETGWRVAPVRRMGAFRRFAWLWEEEYWCRKTAHIYLCRAIRPLGPPVEPDHTPVWMPAGQALSQLYQDGERVFTARAMGVPEEMVTLRGL